MELFGLERTLKICPTPPRILQLTLNFLNSNVTTKKKKIIIVLPIIIIAVIIKVEIICI